jgi:hypothetical protein
MAVTTSEGDEASASSDFLKMENEIKGDEKKVRPHPTLHHIYQAVLLKFDSIVVAVMLEYVLGYIRPLSILLQSEFCD